MTTGWDRIQPGRQPEEPQAPLPGGHGAGWRRRGLRLLAAALAAPAALLAQGTLMREGGRWVQTLTGTAPMASRLRVNCQGPLRVDAGAANEIRYTVKLSVRTASEAEARRLLSGFVVRAGADGDMAVLNANGRGDVNASLSVQAPRLTAAVLFTSQGTVEVAGVEGLLTAGSGAGDIKCDRIGGDVRLTTGGGQIQVGTVGGGVRAATGGGPIIVKSLRGNAVLETGGGDIQVDDAGGSVRADTAGGAVRVTRAGGSVTASTGGGPIVIGTAGGIVITRNMAGPVQIDAAPGVRSESGTGGIRLSNITGPMRVSTAMGSIVASLLGGAPISDSFLATGNGDITVVIPSNVGVTIRAENDLADSMQRIVSDFPSLAVRMRGMQVVAEGSVNGGGPLLRISGMGGTIFIKRQR